MLTIFGLIIIIVLIFVLLKDKISPMVALISVPVAGIILFWFFSALFGYNYVPKNYANKLNLAYTTEFINQIAKQNGYENPTKDLINEFRKNGLKSINLNEKSKLKDSIIDEKKLISFYTNGILSIYPTATNYKKQISEILQDHSFKDRLKDYTDTLKKYYSSGIKKVANIGIMFIFAILFFGVLSDVGLFKPAIDFVIKLTGGNVIAVCVGTAIVAMIAHLDGSGATTFLIVIPPLIPVYKKLNMNPYLLFLIVAASAGLVNMLPWGGPLGRIASVLGVDTVSIYHPLIKIQLVGVVVILAMSAILGIREKRRIKNQNTIKQNLLLYAPDLEGTQETKSNIKKYKFFKINLIIAITSIAILISGYLPPEFVFMLALCIVLLINCKTPKEMLDMINAHSKGAISMGTILFAAGVYVGILSQSGMLESISKAFAMILPDALLPYLHIIIGIFGIPSEIILDTNGHYFTLFPVVAQIVEHYGIEPINAGYAILIGSIAGTFISPFSPALWLGLGLARLSMGKHIAYSFFWLWGISLIILFFSYIMGVI